MKKRVVSEMFEEQRGLKSNDRVLLTRLKGLQLELQISETDLAGILVGVLLSICDEYKTDPVEYVKWAVRMTSAGVDDSSHIMNTVIAADEDEGEES